MSRPALSIAAHTSGISSGGMSDSSTPSAPAWRAAAAKRRAPKCSTGLAYVMSTIGTSDSRRMAATVASTSVMPTPPRSAHSDARWMSGPSAIGSENGMPSSIAAAPVCASATAIAAVSATDG